MEEHDKDEENDSSDVSSQDGDDETDDESDGEDMSESDSSDNEAHPEDDDEDEDEDVDSSSPHKRQKRKAAEIESDSSSDEELVDGERTPKCPICLHRLSKSLVASPDSGCIHNFCLECLREWAKNNNTCPIDRSEFHFLIIKSNISGEELTREEVIKEKHAEDPLVIQDVTLCEVCGSGDREESLLLCDGCDLGYHLDCCNPPLQRVPRGLWYCMNCSAAGLISDYIRLGDCLDRVENNFESQVLPRTMVIERIRRVMRGRQLGGAGAGPSRKRPRTKKRTTKRRKTSTTGKGTKSKPGRKKSKKRKVSKKRLRKKERREKRRQERKSQRENRERDGNSLTLFGRANDLDFYGDEELFVLPSTSSSSTTSSLMPSSSSGAVAIVEQQMNFLENILNAQSNFFTNSSSSRSDNLRNEIYTRPDLEKEYPGPNGRAIPASSTELKSQSNISSTSEMGCQKLPNPKSAKEYTASSVTSSDEATQWRPTEVKEANRFHLGSFRIPRRHNDPISSEDQSEPPAQFKVPRTTSHKYSSRFDDLSNKKQYKVFPEESSSSWKKARFSEHSSKSKSEKNHVEKSKLLSSDQKQSKIKHSKSDSEDRHSTFFDAQPQSDPDERQSSRASSLKEKRSENQVDPLRVTVREEEEVSEHSVPVLSEGRVSSTSKSRHKNKVSSSSNKVEKDLPGFVIHLVKVALAPHYEAKTIPKDIFKVIVRKSSDKVLSREKSVSSVQESKVRQLVEAYVDRYKRKGTV